MRRDARWTRIVPACSLSLVVMIAGAGAALAGCRVTLSRGTLTIREGPGGCSGTVAPGGNGGSVRSYSDWTEEHGVVTTGECVGGALQAHATTFQGVS
jgi:hypothetical protein